MKRPDFFLIGAPRCGTTSLAGWLAEHPAVFMAVEKEPHTFAPDFGRPSVASLAAYEALFAGAGYVHQAVGEASTRYLFSRAAVPAILDYSPDARFIVNLRNPLDMARSLHQHYLYQAQEELGDFAMAWRAQTTRAAGSAIPSLCHDPQLLMYGPLCRLGEQLERLYGLVDRRRVLTVLFDDLVVDPGAQYRRALTFLGLADDGRTDFGARNQARSVRYPALNRILRALALWRRRLGLPRIGLGLLAPLHRANTHLTRQATLDAAMRAELAAYFRDDVARLGELIGRDLGHWLDLPADGEKS